MNLTCLKTFFSPIYLEKQLSILLTSPCFPVPLSFLFAESLSFSYSTLAIYHYINSEQVAMQHNGTDGSSMCTALKNRWWSGDSDLLWYECWVFFFCKACEQNNDKLINNLYILYTIKKGLQWSQETLQQPSSKGSCRLKHLIYSDIYSVIPAFQLFK